jgi:ubiquinol-cytochrome c reductase cytochrome b subunit
VGHYFNSLHLWSVELFMAFMVIHLWGKFFMAAWRGRRALTWITGAVCFLGSLGTAFTGYLVQQNLDSQWIATQSKDALNAVGIGAYFDTMDFGQMLMWHIVLLPATVGLLVVLHILLVRHRGVVPPIALPERHTQVPTAALDNQSADPVLSAPEPTPAPDDRTEVAP